MSTTARFRRLAAASVLATATFASVPAAQAVPAPAALVAASSTATVTSSGAPTSNSTMKDAGSEHLFGYSLFGIILLVLVGSAAWFLRSRRNAPQ